MGYKVDLAGRYDKTDGKALLKAAAKHKRNERLLLHSTFEGDVEIEGEIECTKKSDADGIDMLVKKRKGVKSGAL